MAFQLKQAIGFTLLGLVLHHEVEAKLTSILTLERSVAIAVENDPWLSGSRYREQAIIAQSIAAATLPDPVVSVSMANLPIDGFNFNQEPMTQLKAGVTQQFSRGQSLEIRSRQLQQRSNEQPLLRNDRKARTRLTVTQVWLDAYQAQHSISLIEQDKALFAQLSDIAQANYSSAIGRYRQQDIVRAQLELTQLEDRLSRLHISKQQAIGQLVEWLMVENSWQHIGGQDHAEITLPDELPTLRMLAPEVVQLITGNDQQALVSHLLSHPYILAIEQQIKSSETGVDLAEQQYQPQWGVNAAYAYRPDNEQGSSRADFFSIGVTVELPIFTANKQEQRVKSAIAQTEALKTERQLALRQMLSQVKSLFTQLQQYQQRKQRYTEQILVQIADQADASLNAYTNDDGDFAEVVRARIAALNANIEALDIDIKLAKTIAQLRYLLHSSNTADKAQTGQ